MFFCLLFKNVPCNGLNVFLIWYKFAITFSIFRTKPLTAKLFHNLIQDLVNMSIKIKMITHYSNVIKGINYS